MELEGKRAIVTGAGSGFGLAITGALLEKGCRTAALDISEDRLKSLKEKHPSVETYICDVSDNASVEAVVNSVFECFHGLEILINNAGIMKNSPLINPLNRDDNRHAIDLWEQVIKVNQSSVFYMTRSVAGRMMKNRNKGVVVNISSIAASGNVGQTAYSASKAAVEAMTKVWAKELGRFGIRSVAVAPGFINTQGTADALEESMLKQWVDKTPLRRTGEVSEIVDTVLYALRNDFINGRVLAVDGGLVL